MSPELQKALTEIAGVLADASKWGAATVKQELPLLVQEYLKWGMAESIMAIVIALVVLVGYACTARRVWVWGEQPGMSNEGPAGLYLLLGAGVSLIALSELISYTSTLIQILVAPRVYLLERLRSLVP